MAEQITDALADQWLAALDQEARRLNLADPDDRTIFRSRMLRRTAHTRVDLLRALARHFGATDIPATRTGATRALANAHIDRLRSQS